MEYLEIEQQCLPTFKDETHINHNYISRLGKMRKCK